MGKISWSVTFALCTLVLLGTYFGEQQSYLMMAMLLMVAAFIPFFARFEGRQVTAGEIVLLAQLVALAAVVRIPFAAIPSVQPTSFVVMIAAMTLGSERGFLVGALAALVSNLFLGQGPWTPWQMFAWGMMGMTAGLLRHGLIKWRWCDKLFGFGWGLLFGWFMNLWYLCSLGENFAWQLYVMACIASFPMDMAHGLGNVFFLTLFKQRFVTIMERIRLKYRL